PFRMHVNPVATNERSAWGWKAAASTIVNPVKVPKGSATGANACILPGTICLTMEIARSTALAASVEKTAILCAVLSALKPAPSKGFAPSDVAPIAMMQRKMIAYVNRKKYEDAKGRTGLRFLIILVSIRFS